MLTRQFVFILASIAVINAHVLGINEYSSEVCSYVNQSIHIDIMNIRHGTIINYLVFHYKDIQVSNIPEFTRHTGEAPKRCVSGDESDGCSRGEGYNVHFDSDQHDPILNSKFNEDVKEASYVVNTPGFYCVYLDTNTMFSGNVEFNNSFSIGLDIDNYTRFRVDLSVLVPFYLMLTIYVFVKRFPWRLKALVGSLALIYCLRMLSLGLVSIYGKTKWTLLFNTLFGNITKNIIILAILTYIMYCSVGYNVVEDESMIFKDTRIMLWILFSYFLLSCFNEFYFNVSMIPYYDLHFNSLRRYLLLLEQIPAVLIYVSIVSEIMHLQKYEVKDTRIKSSFMVLAVFAPTVVVFKLILGAFVIHRLHDPEMFDSYYYDVSIFVMTFFTDVLMIICITYLCHVWRPKSYQVTENREYTAVNNLEV